MLSSIHRLTLGPKNDEFLTDLTTVMFGLGVFMANVAFQTYAGSNYKGWRSQGY